MEVIDDYIIPFERREYSALDLIKKGHWHIESCGGIFINDLKAPNYHGTSHAVKYYECLRLASEISFCDGIRDAIRDRFWMCEGFEIVIMIDIEKDVDDIELWRDFHIEQKKKHYLAMLMRLMSTIKIDMIKNLSLIYDRTEAIKGGSLIVLQLIYTIPATTSGG